MNDGVDRCNHGWPVEKELSAAEGGVNIKVLAPKVCELCPKDSVLGEYYSPNPSEIPSPEIQFAAAVEESAKPKSRAWLAERMNKVFEKCQALRGAGQKEYAHDKDNAFANFERLADDLNLDTEEILWVFLKKHLDGILAHIRGHRSQREDVRGRIRDAIVYLSILHAMVDDTYGTED